MFLIGWPKAETPFQSLSKHHSYSLLTGISGGRLPLPPSVWSKSEIPRCTFAAHHFSALQGSLSLEASVGIPFLIAFLTLGMVLLQMLSLTWSLQQTVQKTARELAVWPEEQVSETAAALRCDAMIAEEDISLSLVDGGILGLNYGKTTITDQEIDLCLTCRLRVPFRILGRRTVDIAASAHAVRWRGFDAAAAQAEETEVYITPYGEAWHGDLSCGYLSPSVRQAPGSEVSFLRNTEGKKYAPCPLCHPKTTGAVCLTDYGTIYHASETCSALKRTPLAVSRAEAQKRGYHPCPRCGGS